MKLQCHLRQKLLLIQDLFHQPNSRLHEGIWPVRIYTGTGILNILHVSDFLHFEIEQCARAIALRQPEVYSPRKTNGYQDRHNNQNPMIFCHPEKVFRGIETRIHSSSLLPLISRSGTGGTTSRFSTGGGRRTLTRTWRLPHSKSVHSKE